MLVTRTGLVGRIVEGNIDYKFLLKVFSPRVAIYFVPAYKARRLPPCKIQATASYYSHITHLGVKLIYHSVLSTILIVLSVASTFPINGTYFLAP